MTAYYNEIDPFAAQWLRNLIAAGLIAPGVVDERSITDVRPSELAVFTQCHFFAGIGGWSRALRLAGWPDDEPVWTGSCPCQPFSVAGKGKGAADERHLWPVWFDLIRECRPPAVFGEQVAAAVGHNWLDAVQGDLEGEGYAVGSAVLGAHSVGAPHIRQRLWFVADARCQQRIGRQDAQRPVGKDPSERIKGCADDQRSGDPRILADANEQQRHRSGNAGPERRGELADERDSGWVADAASERERADEPGSDCGARQLLVGPGARGYRGDYGADGGSGPLHGFWRNADWLFCRDGKWRPVEPGTFPLAHGVSGRVGRLRAYGNAIVPAVAAEFIEAYMEIVR